MVKRFSAPSRRLALTGFTLIGITIVAAALAVWQRQDETVARYGQELGKLSIVLAEQTARSLQGIDLVLQEIQAKVAADSLAAPEQSTPLMGSAGLHEFLTERIKVLPQAKAVGLLAADGKLVNASSTSPLGKHDLSQRDYFVYFRTHDDPNLFVSVPARAINGGWTFFLARRLNDRNHNFAGVVVGLVDAEYLEGFYHAISPEAGDGVTLLRQDGTVLVRYPHLESALGRPISSLSPWYATIERGGGMYRTPGYLGGLPRLVATHPVAGYPLAINASVSEDTAFADWRRETLLIAGAALGGVIGYALLFRALAARSRRLERQTAELSQVAEALRKSEARFRDLVTSTSDWLWESDANHRFTYISPSSRQFGHEPTEILGRTRAEVAAPNDRDAAKWEQHMAMLDRHEPFRDFVYVRGDNEIVMINGNPVFDEEGRFTGYRGTARDVTAQVRAEISLREAKIAAEAANIAKSQFLANISHELRTPLNAIIGFSDMLLAGLAGQIDDRPQEYSRIINSSGKHLLHIVNDLLDIAKIDAGKFSLESEEIDPARFTAACIEMVREAANQQQLQLVAEVAPDTPAFIGDARRLKQVILNLLSNAIKFTDPSGRVVLRAVKATDGGIAFGIEDSGLGMDATEVEVALEPFGQVDAGLNRRRDGAGLGLPLARSLIEQHGGTMRIDSEKGRGTCITVSLPPNRVVPAKARNYTGDTAAAA